MKMWMWMCRKGNSSFRRFVCQLKCKWNYGTPNSPKIGATCPIFSLGLALDLGDWLFFLAAVVTPTPILCKEGLIGWLFVWFIERALGTIDQYTSIGMIDWVFCGFCMRRRRVRGWLAGSGAALSCDSARDSLTLVLTSPSSIIVNGIGILLIVVIVIVIVIILF